MEWIRRKVCVWFCVVIIAGTAGLSFAEETISSFKARGVIRTRQHAVISSEISGRITRLPFFAGESFFKGDLLVAFDCRLLTAEQERTAAKLVGAEKKFENDLELQGFSSIGALDVSLDEVDVQLRKAEFQIAKISVARCRILAPFSGRVVEKMANVFESVQPHQELLKIVNPKSLEIEMMVPSSWLSWLKQKSSFCAVIDETGEMATGCVKTLGAVVDPVSKMIQVRGNLDVKSRGLLPGMSVNVEFVKNAKKHDG